MTNSSSQLLPIGAMARQLGVKVSWLREEADKGTLPAVRAGETYLFNPIDIERVLLKRAASAAKEVDHG